jgi:hypothetical protein
VDGLADLLQLAEHAEAFLAALKQAAAAEHAHVAALDRHGELLDAAQPAVSGMIRRQVRVPPPGSRPVSRLFMQHELLAQLPGYARRS